MLDFYRIMERETKKAVEVFPDFIVKRSKDLMVRGGSFYAIWDEEAQLWSTDEYDVQRLVDAELFAYAEQLKKDKGITAQVRYLSSFGSKAWAEFRNYMRHLSDSSHQLDVKLTFANTKVGKNDYVSRKLPYSLEAGDISAYRELFGTLYSPEQLEKLEWAIGAIVSGDAKNIQKFLVLYGEAGTGKSTWLNLVQQLFDGYYTTFDAKALTGNGNSFSTEAFKSNPLVAIQHDGDLSKIEDNTKLNSIVSHEFMSMNEKYKPSYTARANALLLMGTNKPVKITDSKSGIIRRLIDVHPTGKLISPRRYGVLTAQLGFELGAIAEHCLSVYQELGKNYYSGYRPLEMQFQTDTFFNYIEFYFDIFTSQPGITLKQAWEMYKTYCEEASMEYKLPMHRFRDEFRNYFDTFEERVVIDGVQVRSWYSGFKTGKFTTVSIAEEHQLALDLDEAKSLLDELLANCPAQMAKDDGTPLKYWSRVKTKLQDVITTELHYVKPPENHIVIDFDLGLNGEKNLAMNLEAASHWPLTYAEYSKSGTGVHLHYIYDGDVSKLSRVFAEGIEIKVFTGDSSLRRKLSKCNNIPVATISGGLPLKEEKVLSADSIKSERALRTLIARNLAKEIHPGTKSSVDFIKKILDDAYASDLVYDVTDLRQKILAFASQSTHQAEACIKLVMEMKFASEEKEHELTVVPSDNRRVYFDLEVFPNLFVCCWKYEGDANVVKMINPSPQAIEQLVRFKLVGFNNRRYDNHIMYARIMGYTNLQLYNISQRIVAGEQSSFFGEAYDLSWADVYDYSSVKQSLKVFQIKLGLHHQELGLPWDQPVPEELWEQVADYCANDVITTEKVAEDREQDYVARQILAELSGLPINATTQKHTARIIFGKDKNPQDKFVYTDLSEQFPGYKYEFGKSEYLGEIVGEGGLVRAVPGMYTNVAVLDVASMHPTSIKVLNLFGPYTDKFVDLLRARLAIKRSDYDGARQLLTGRLAPFLGDPANAKALADALKIAINIVYGLTSASFSNPFRDPRNKDNIVAKRGALFMIDLMKAVQDRGFKVVHIKTDSIKIPDATPEIIEFVIKFGEKYGYEFEHETTYTKFCLVNDAVYIAKTAEPDKKTGLLWTATGAQFAHPYVFKTLFSKESVEFKDKCETKTVTTALYLGHGDDEPQFVGRAGSFVPVLPGTGGGTLLRGKDGTFHAATGTKGYFWKEADVVKTLGLEDEIDMSYFIKLADEAVSDISKYGDFEWFTS